MNILKSGKTTYGGWVQTGSVAVVEVMASSHKFDWICIDLEHGLDDGFGSIANMITTMVLHGVIPVVRVPKNDYKWIGKSLDAGAKGIIVPMVNTVKEAEDAVSAVKYPPTGFRSFGYSKSNCYGLNFKECVETDNDEIALIVQIEHQIAIENLPEILRVQGIDGTFIGPLDLKGSIDINLDDILFQRWMDKYLEHCKEAGLPAGIHVVEPTKVEIDVAVKSGYKMIAVGTDAVLLRQRIGDIL